MATRDLIALAGGPSYSQLNWEEGMGLMGEYHPQPVFNTPQPSWDSDQLNTLFSSHGLTQTDMVAPSGAHTIDFSHCCSFANHIYHFSPRTKIDPTLNLHYAFQLRQECPNVVYPRIAINMDQSPLKHSTMCITKTFSKERDCSPLIKLCSWKVDAGTLSANLLLVVQDWE